MRVRLTSRYSRPIAAQDSAAVRISFQRGADAQDHHHALDQRAHRLGIVGEEIGHGLLQHDAPQQGGGEDEDLFFFLRDGGRVLDRAHDHPVGEEGAGEAGGDAGQCAQVRTGAERAGDPPGDDRGHHHDRAMRQVQHAGDAEDQREAGGAERVEAADREAVDQDLQSEHETPFGCVDGVRRFARDHGRGAVRAPVTTMRNEARTMPGHDDVLSRPFGLTAAAW